MRAIATILTLAASCVLALGLTRPPSAETNVPLLGEGRVVPGGGTLI